MNTETEILVKALNGFFYIYLPKQKCFSKNTVDSYKAGKRLTKQRTCQTRSPSERIIPCNGRVILRAVLKIHALAEKIH